MDSSGIRANMSAQQLLNNEVYDRTSAINASLEANSDETGGSSSLASSTNKLDIKQMSSSSASTSSTAVDARNPQSSSFSKRQLITVAILCFVNLINYMDRFTIAGILTDIQCDFKIGDTEGGLLQTAFIASYMVCAPIFGYLGDRYSRRAIMASGIFIWSLTTLLGSFMDDFWMFLVMRSFVGIGEASYSTIAPTIISDMFVGDMRSKMLALFYFAIPVGSGLGYIVGSQTAKLIGSWHWGLRVTPIAGALAVLLILFVTEDPPRGESEGAHLVPTSWWADIKSLCKNKSFIMSTFGSTAVAFVAGALAWWGPKFITLGLAAQKQEDVSMDEVSYIFGLIAMLAGLVGVPLGSFLGQKLRLTYPRADPLVCGAGLLLSTPFLLAGLITAGFNTTACFCVIFFGQVLLNLNWSIVADMCLYVVIPTRRSTAEAFQILLSHALGDAGSPYIIGQVSEILKKSWAPAVDDFDVDLADHNVHNVSCSGSTINFNTVQDDFKALQYSLFISVIVEVLGAFFFFITAWYIIDDKARVDRAVAGMDLDETAHLSPSQNRRPSNDESSLPEEEQPITIIATGIDYLPVV